MNAFSMVEAGKHHHSLKELVKALDQQTEMNMQQRQHLVNFVLNVVSRYGIKVHRDEICFCYAAELEVGLNWYLYFF